ncbi:hypothetical protein M1N56_06240 [Dehalococcoidia bacterium]|nr:hypothetical protein [Dehalococcoidia bacterium]
MAPTITEHLQDLNDLGEALPEIEDASRKMAAYDRYYSQGGSPDSGDYYEVQRILKGRGDSDVILPPKIPLRNDLELMAESIVFYAIKIGRYRIGIDELQGFILPQNLSPGERTEIVAATVSENNSSHQLELIGSHFVLIGQLKEKIYEQISGLPQERITDWVRGTSSARVQLNRPKTMTEILRDRLKNVEQRQNEDKTTVETINSLGDLRSSVRRLMNENCPVESIATEPDISRVIEILQN